MRPATSIALIPLRSLPFIAELPRHPAMRNSATEMPCNKPLQHSAVFRIVKRVSRKSFARRLLSRLNRPLRTTDPQLDDCRQGDHGRLNMAIATLVDRTRDDEEGRMRLVVVAASLGTVFEWYDFFLYGSLAVFFSALFFPPGNETAAFLASLATFGAGFAVRPLGALLFGALGDRIGRKRSFLIPMVIMGFSTLLIGLLPIYAQVGLWAPILLVTLRLAQGLAVGGEYGGAATYVAEHAPPCARGYATSWLQTTGTIGFLMSLIVILACRVAVDDDAFRAWGWRVPFLTSAVLLVISVYIRLK